MFETFSSCMFVKGLMLGVGQDDDVHKSAPTRIKSPARPQLAISPGNKCTSRPDNPDNSIQPPHLSCLRLLLPPLPQHLITPKTEMLRMSALASFRQAAIILLGLSRMNSESCRHPGGHQRFGLRNQG